ncbi:dihydrofolate reductase family protein [Labedaea rhizosphaerae]|uniref:Dihydrofolate reductase n=1 Tax=Labedaea rhizosphaerae TaxID=598644 RepID=A0A4R6S5A8_LABRH|nr:dihydrofolate reductase family protein [Labedaea rhizosphaerae]TDP94979.1 dihydrofolate reductase [Labedaea rhizosphaerae]
MGKLIYSMIQSLDGYTKAADGTHGWGAPEDEELHGYINELSASVGTFLYGRRMYETMAYWETAHLHPGQPPVVLEWARLWQATEKVVYSRTLAEPSSARTRIEREFDPAAVRRLKDSSEQDLTIDGPELAGQAVKAGLVDEYHLIIAPVLVGGGTRFFPDGAHADLDLVEERGFANGVVVLRYSARR